jgi:hypothetical protein
MKKWLYIRVALVLVNLMPIGNPTEGSHRLDWLNLAIIFAFSSLWMPLALTLCRLGPQTSYVGKLLTVFWTKPSWYENPFDLHQPVQFLHLAGFVMMALGISRFVVGAWPTPGAMFLALGGGLWVGTWLSVLIHQNRFQQNKPLGTLQVR